MRRTLLGIVGALILAVAWYAYPKEPVFAPTEINRQIVTNPLVLMATSLEPKATKITFVGDIMLDRNVRTRMDKFKASYPFAKIRNTIPFVNADLLIGNLEGAISKRLPPVKSIDFAFDEEVALLLAEQGFDAVSLANNHALDQGRTGYTETQKVLGRANVGFFGDQVHDDTGPWVKNVNGKSMAFFGYNTTDNTLDEDKAQQSIRTAAETHDIVVVFMHWGAEYVPRPAASIQSQGRQFIEWGADAVIGSHPHVMQGMEFWQGRPIFWSLGNFIFDQDWSTETQRGLVVMLEFNAEKTTAHLWPTIVKKSQPALAEGEEREQLLQRFIERSTLLPEAQTQALAGAVTWNNE